MRIVVRGANWVGDAVMTIPALRELRRIFPDASISLHTRSWAVGIFQDADFIDEIIPFERGKNKVKTILEQSKILHSGKFDLCVIFPNSFESALTAKLGRISSRFGYKKEARNVLLTNSIDIPLWKNQKHEVYYYLNLIAEIENKFFGKKTVLDNNPRFGLDVSEERKSSARKILADNGVDLSKKTIAFVAGSTNSRAKRWQTQSFASLNNLVQSNLKANVILIGAEDELNVSLEVFEKSLVKPVILTGLTTLAEATSILSVCDLLVSNDTGPAHIAAALETKTIVIFGPTNPVTTQPWNSVLIRKDVECSPCMLRDCPIDHRCMAMISPQEIFEKIISHWRL